MTWQSPCQAWQCPPGQQHCSSCPTHNAGYGWSEAKNTSLVWSKWRPTESSFKCNKLRNYLRVLMQQQSWIFSSYASVARFLCDSWPSEFCILVQFLNKSTLVESVLQPIQVISVMLCLFHTCGVRRLWFHTVYSNSWFLAVFSRHMFVATSAHSPSLRFEL